jgi:hypothetical protein
VSACFFTDGDGNLVAKRIGQAVVQPLRGPFKKLPAAMVG